MCIMVLGQMAERKKGFILNVASCSAVVPTPLMSLYSSTKVSPYPEIVYVRTGVLNPFFPINHQGIRLQIQRGFGAGV
jgi:hypothetical protein